MPNDDIDWLFTEMSMKDRMEEAKKRADKERLLNKYFGQRQAGGFPIPPSWLNQNHPANTSKKKKKDKKKRPAHMPKENAMIDFILVKQEKEKKDPWDD